MKTLLLDRTLWDLCKDAAGNIAVASDPYATAQDVGSACITLLGECWYNTTDGVPLTQRIMGGVFPAAFFKAQIIKAAQSVPGVVRATCAITSIKDRDLSAQVQVTLAGNVSFTVTVGAGNGTISPPEITFDFSKASKSAWLPGV